MQDKIILKTDAEMLEDFEAELSKVKGLSDILISLPIYKRTYRFEAGVNKDKKVILHITFKSILDLCKGGARAAGIQFGQNHGDDATIALGSIHSISFPEIAPKKVETPEESVKRVERMTPGQRAEYFIKLKEQFGMEL